MNELSAILNSPYSLPGGLAVVVLLVIWLVLVRRGRRKTLLAADNLLRETSYGQLQALILPSAEDGEIQLERIVLLRDTIMVVEIRDVAGVVFGSDRMQDWTVIDGDRRYTLANPQTRLLDCVAAVRQFLPDVAVDGAVLFTDAAQFTKGIPRHVVTVAEWLKQYPKLKNKERQSLPPLLEPAWQQLKDASIDAQVGKLLR